MRVEYVQLMWLDCAGPFALCLNAGALVSVLRSTFSAAAKTAWACVVLLVPVLGASFWLAAHRTLRKNQRGDVHS
ncbi:PLDc_N domain-containing protein [Arthrobacter sp. SF27]|nr:PLDc_N domain-containing protein [Arthrobacter sp. SF27]